jgi:prolyl-tRNA editing enzyme YbaK/EbsC (Cys-tRNA(Pro) deacylase)
MDKHPITQEILEILKKNGCWHETFEHEPVRTSEEAAKTRPGYSLKQGAKAIIVRAKISGGEKRFLMLVMPADQKFSSGKVKALLGAKDIRFATEEEVSGITKGVKPGAVPPFGNLFGLEVITDKTLYDNEKIVFNAGERTFSVAMKSEDYNKLVMPRLESIV